MFRQQQIRCEQCNALIGLRILTAVEEAQETSIDFAHFTMGFYCVECNDCFAIVVNRIARNDLLEQFVLKQHSPERDRARRWLRNLLNWKWDNRR